MASAGSPPEGRNATNRHGTPAHASLGEQAAIQAGSDARQATAEPTVSGFGAYLYPPSRVVG